MEQTVIPLPKMPWNIYWINLDRRPDRKEHMEHLLCNNKENHFRIQAVDYQNNFYPYTVIRHPNLNAGEHGCSSSHIKALAYFLETSEDKYCFIAEDDLSNEYSDYWQEKHYEYLKSDTYEILQLQTTGNSYTNISGTIDPEKICDAGTTIYKISRIIANKIVANHFNKEQLTINLLNLDNPVTDVLVWNYGDTYLLPMFSYLDVQDSDTNKEVINDYWQNFFKAVKTKYLMFWKKIHG
jgi:hypothetical protein